MHLKFMVDNVVQHFISVEWLVRFHGPGRTLQALQKEEHVTAAKALAAARAAATAVAASTAAAAAADAVEATKATSTSAAFEDAVLKATVVAATAAAVSVAKTAVADAAEATAQRAHALVATLAAAAEAGEVASGQRTATAAAVEEAAALEAALTHAARERDAVAREVALREAAADGELRRMSGTQHAARIAASLFKYTDFGAHMAEQYPQNGFEAVLYVAEGPVAFTSFVETLFFGEKPAPYFVTYLPAHSRRLGAAVPWLDSMGVVGLKPLPVIEALVDTCIVLLDNLFDDELNVRSASDIAATLKAGSPLLHALHASFVATEAVCAPLNSDCSPPQFMVAGQLGGGYGITYKPYLEYVISVADSTGEPRNLGTHIDGFTTGTCLSLLSGIKIVVAARPTLANLIKFGHNRGKRMMDVRPPYEDMVALVMYPGDVMAIPALSVHEVVNLSSSSCMAGRTCQTPATTEPLVEEICTCLAEGPPDDRVALAYVVQMLVQNSSADSEAAVEPSTALHLLRELMLSHRAGEQDE